LALKATSTLQLFYLPERYPPTTSQLLSYYSNAFNPCR